MRFKDLVVADGEELISFANGQVSDSDFLSKNDGEEFVFVWGTELNRRSATPVVIGYESAGKDGKRMVFTTMGTMTLSQEEFSASEFPAGHSPDSTSQD